MRRFDAGVTSADLPTVFASPFDAAAPHPIARRAALELLDDVRAGRFGISASTLDAPGGGKMFGVLVVASGDGHVGYLRAFSGMVDGSWDIDGFAPPVFDRVRRDRMWPAGQDALRDHDLALRALDADPRHDVDRRALAAFDRSTDDQLAAMCAQHRGNRASRRQERAGRVDADRSHALDQASRADAAERRRFEQARAALRLPLAERVAAYDHERRDLEIRRRDESRRLMTELHDTYVIQNARGEHRSLRSLFAPGEPPGGAGDCAGPKLLAEAYRRGLRPVALAEIWIGAPPATGGRHTGVFYPSCRGKCGPILGFMLEGIPHEPATVHGAAPPDDTLTVVFEDDWLIVIDKPVGLLSVPGRSGRLRDSALSRIRARWPDATGPLLVHRLDLDTSGVLVAAKDEHTHTALQAQFARREIDKRYLAIVDGVVRGEDGVIELALRVDLDDRPRQIVDPIHGRPAVTRWSALARTATTTRVALSPLTGRTHQLRVHAAHPSGLAAPIVGDRLYGRTAAPRLLLHAERLAFVHPATGARTEVVSAAPF